MSYRLQSSEMPLRLLILGLGLDKGDGSRVEIFAWYGALIEQRLAAVVNLLFRVKGFLGGLRIQLCLLQLFWNGITSGNYFGSLRLREIPTPLLRRSREIFVFQRQEQ